MTEDIMDSRKEYIMCVVRGLFGDLGFIRQYKGINYYAYTLGDNYGSVSIDAVSAYYYINGHIGFLYPEDWDENSKDRVYDDIKAHMFWHAKSN